MAEAVIIACMAVFFALLCYTVKKAGADPASDGPPPPDANDGAAQPPSEPADPDHPQETPARRVAAPRRVKTEERDGTRYTYRETESGIRLEVSCDLDNHRSRSTAPFHSAPLLRASAAGMAAAHRQRVAQRIKANAADAAAARENRRRAEIDEFFAGAEPQP